MRPDVFVDSGPIIAQFHPQDSRHADSLRVMNELRQGSRSFVTSTDVMGETLSLLRRWAGYAVARVAGEELWRSFEVDVVTVDDGDRRKAWELFLLYRIPKLSFVDCTSAALMRRLGLREIFTFDEDFRSLGFDVHPAPRPLLKPNRAAKPRARRR